MAAAQHKLSRREVLAGACAGAAAGADGLFPLLRHSGLDPESILLPAAEKERWMQDQVRHDDKPDLSAVEGWRRALDRYARAAAGLEAVAHVEDDALYDRALGRHNRALARLLRAAAPDLAAAADKLDLIMRHSVFELTFAEPCLEALRRDLRRFAGQVAVSPRIG